MEERKILSMIPERIDSTNYKLQKIINRLEVLIGLSIIGIIGILVF